MLNLNWIHIHENVAKSKILYTDKIYGNFYTNLSILLRGYICAFHESYISGIGSIGFTPREMFYENEVSN